MVASKPLILLKGIGGLAATSLATLGGMEVGYKFLSSKTVDRTEREEGSWGIEFEPEEYTEEISGLRIPSGCVETCELTAEELRGLKFEVRNESSILFDGLTEEDTFELAISEVSEDPTNYPRGKKYILKAKATTGTVTIKNVKGDDIVLGENGEVELRETDEGGRLEKIPEEVNDLGIPKRCEGDSAEDSTAQTCELTREQLQRLKFEPKNSGGSISVSGLKDNERVELNIEDSSDSTNYPKNKKYTLKSTTGTVTIKGVKDGDVVLEANQAVDFREKSTGNQLETVEDSLGIPRRCTPGPSCQLTKEELQRLKFETGDENTSIEIDGLDDSEKVELTVAEVAGDLTNYPKGKKYTLKSTSGEVTIKGVKGGDIVLEDDQEGVVIRETTSGGKLEKAPEEVNELGIPKRCKAEQATGDTKQTCELTKEQLQRFKFEPKGNEEITVYGLAEGNKVTLEIEAKSKDAINFPRGKKYTLKTTTGTVTIRNVKEGDIFIGARGNVAIRETGRGGKLEKVSEEVDGLGIPTRCTTTQPCKLTKDQLQKLKFETKSSSSISISGLRENYTVDLKVEKITDKTNYPKGKKYTLTSTSGKVTIKGVKGGDIDIEDKVVVIREKQSGGLLEKGAEEVNALGIPGRCISQLSCELTKDQLQRLKFETNGNSPIQVTGLGIKEKVTLKVDDPKDKTNYPKDRRYSFKVEKEGVTIKGTKDGDIVLEKGKELLIREKPSGGQLETLLDSMGIPRSCNVEKVKKGSEPQTCQLTAELLKNIKFKKFNEKRSDVKVTGLDDGSIKLKISWTKDSRYPDNKKYSFDNEVWRNWDIKITRSGQNEQRVTIAKQKESWFKNEGGQLELVEKKEKAEVKTEEANEILEKLGLERLKLKSSGGSSDFNSFISKKHNKKTADFYSVDELKKIQFKELGGGAESTVPSSLNSNKKIRVSLDWDDDANKFPYNMKFSFQNENFSLFDFKKGENSVKILKNLKDAFKVENQGDKWYLVKSS